MNMIVILLDSLRRDHLGAYGNEWINTPNFDALADQSTVFDNAYIGSHPCMPARRDMWTGRFEFPWRGWGPLEPDDVDFASIMKASGKTAMLITDHYHLWERGSGNYHFNFTGFEFIRGQESDWWKTEPLDSLDYDADLDKMAKHARPMALQNYARNTASRTTEEDYFFPRVVNQASDWLERNHSHEDFLLFIDSFDPHEPWDPPEHYWKQYNPGYSGQQVIWPKYGSAAYLSPEELEQVRALYAGEVTMVDKWLGVLLDRIETLGLLENTVVVITTDHGVLLGEHGMIGKPWASMGDADANIYQELAHIPMMIRHPNGIPQRREELVQLVDLFPTILEGVNVDVPGETHGYSLHGLVTGAAVAWPRKYAWWGRFGEAICITDGLWLLMKWPGGSSNAPLKWHSYSPPSYSKLLSSIGERKEDGYPVSLDIGNHTTALFNLSSDSGQNHNVADEYPNEARRLEEALAEKLRSVDAPSEQLERLGLDSSS